jgi:glycosyltransferase involved in cell wall biosynthesis
VGDAGIILGEAGKLVPSDDVETFALAIMETIRLPVEQRMALGSNARKRIEDNFSIVRATENYANLYHSLLGGS